MLKPSVQFSICSLQVMLLWFALLALTSSSKATLMTIEAESSRGHQTTDEMWRGEASGEKTLRVSTGSMSSYAFCLLQPTSVQVESIVYTNDGGSDEVLIMIDNQAIGSFWTQDASDGGALWNVPKSSGVIGSSLLLEPGLHRVKLIILSTDHYGLELDSILMNVDDSFLSSSSKTFTCELPCLQNSPPLVSQAETSVSDGFMQQESYQTLCAEEDNVDIPIFHPSVSEYTITATPPLYHSLVNHRYEDTSNCAFLPPEYWTLTNIKIDDLQESDPLTFDGVTFGLSDTDVNEVSSDMQLEATFQLQGISEGYIDSEIGSKVELSLSGLTNKVDVSMFYKGRSASFTKTEAVKFSSPSDDYTWHLPDFTWQENDDNQIVLRLATSQTSGIVVKHFQLERRYMGPDKITNSFSNSEVNIEGLDVDFWWRAPETMQVSLTNGQTWPDTDYLRISVPVPWNTTWSQVLVLYQDGNLRLLPIALPGTDWIPFGTSVVVGQANPNDHRPVAPISTVLINPADLTLNITYRDGGFARLELLPLVEKTMVVVRDLTFTQNTTSHSFAIFRSMFVDAGNDDSDSVLTDTTGPTHVMGDWEKMSGTSFMVYRRCESNHLTQSPDLRVNIIKA